MTPHEIDILYAREARTKQLWAAVIQQALDDATGVIFYSSGNYKGAADRAKKAIRKRARSWFIEGGKDFKEVCALAGLDPDWIRANALKRIEEAGDGDGPIKRGRLISYKGERLTINELSARTGLSRDIIGRRLRRGLTGDQLTAPSAPPSKPTPITHNGETRTAAEWSEITGIKAGTIAHRLKKGWTIQEALTPGRRKPPARMTEKQKQALGGFSRSAPRGRTAKLYVHDGKTLTVQQWSKVTGINVKTIRCRLRDGLSIADALRPERTASPRLYTHDGKTMTLSAWAKHLGIPRTTLRTRLDQRGWSIEQALTTPVKSNASVERKAA